MVDVVLLALVDVGATVVVDPDVDGGPSLVDGTTLVDGDEVDAGAAVVAGTAVAGPASSSPAQEGPTTASIAASAAPARPISDLPRSA